MKLLLEIVLIKLTFFENKNYFYYWNKTISFC